MNKIDASRDVDVSLGTRSRDEKSPCISDDGGREVVEICFQRTVRVPNDGTLNGSPPNFGHFPLWNVHEFGQKIPLPMREKGGLILPMWCKLVSAVWLELLLAVLTKKEALWLQFRDESDFNAEDPRRRAIDS